MHRSTIMSAGDSHQVTDAPLSFTPQRTCAPTMLLRNEINADRQTSSAMTWHSTQQRLELRFGRVSVRRRAENDNGHTEQSHAKPRRAGTVVQC